MYISAALTTPQARFAGQLPLRRGALLTTLYISQIRTTYKVIMNKKNKKQTENSNGVSEAAHILSMFATGFGAVFLIIFINTVFYIKFWETANNAVLKFFSAAPLKALAASDAAVLWCGIAAAVLICADIFIYRHVVKKIFEHISIIFLGAGAFSLLFMIAFSPDLLYLLVCALLLLIGALFMLLYGLAYHIMNERSQTP